MNNKNSFLLLALLTFASHHEHSIASEPASKEQLVSNERQRPKYNFSGLAGLTSSFKKTPSQASTQSSSLGNPYANNQANVQVVRIAQATDTISMKPPMFRVISSESARNSPISSSQESSASSSYPSPFGQSISRRQSSAFMSPLSEAVSTPRLDTQSVECDQPPTLPPTPEPCVHQPIDVNQATSIQFCLQAQRNLNITDAQWMNTQARLGKLFRNIKNPLVDSTGYQAAFAQILQAPSADHYKEQFKQAVQAAAQEKDVTYSAEVNLFANSRANTPIASINSHSSLDSQRDTVALDLHVHKRSNSTTWNHLLHLYVHTSDMPNALAETLKARAQKEIACEAAVAYYDHEIQETTKR
ncbi:MAG: hypothetical protein P4L31_05715 [Candidatus Babeliales bacterium]|nr:hypothetical protein [Candidatus Babeliales bacterium]